MRLSYKTSKLTYKSLFGYSLVIIALLVIAVPAFANTKPGSKLLDFSSTDTGNSIQSARPLSQGINVNHLNPGEENWYVYNRESFNDPPLSWVSLALRTESEALISSEQVNFHIFAQQQDGSWFQPAETPDEALGAGIPSPLRAANRNLIETFWSGQVQDNQQYFVRVFNNSPFGLDYTLEAKTEQPAVSGATPASFGSAAAAIPANVRQTAWTLTAQAVNNMPADQAATWMQQAQAVGWLVTEGTDPTQIPKPGEADPDTLWRLTAQAIEGQDAETATQWLVQADSLGWLAIPLNTLKDPTVDVQPEETGGGGDDGGAEPPAQPIQPDQAYTPVNIYPNQPLTFDFYDVNSGRLAPYGEHWYELTLNNPSNDSLIENMKLTMFFTPREGFTSDRVNFELFPASQYHIWTRGDVDYMEHFGLGLWVSRDEDPHTGERLWNGTLVDGDRYLVKVKNGTSEVVDYYLYPDDVENAELGNPTLHQQSGSAENSSYPAAPPTRQGPPPAPGEGPPEAISLELGTTTDQLEAGEERWYRFYVTDPYNKDASVHDFKIYLTNTPQDDVRARHADFAIYPGDQLHIWSRGTIDQLTPLGTSSPSPNELDDETSLQVVWDGQLMESQVYYIKVYNHDIGPLEYELEVQGGP